MNDAVTVGDALLFFHKGVTGELCSCCKYT